MYRTENFQDEENDGEIKVDGDDCNDIENNREDEQDVEGTECQQQFDKSQTSFVNWQMCEYLYRLVWRPTIFAKDHILVLLTFSLIFHWTYEATLIIFSWMNRATFNGGMPVHKKTLWKALGRNDLVQIRHYICEHCHTYLGMNETKQCSVESCRTTFEAPSIGYFIQIDLESQITELFAIPGIYDQLQYRYTRVKKNSHSLEDIYDGKIYKELSEPGKFLSNKNNFTFTLNTDGASVADSSKASAWPVFLQINELSPHLRKKHMILGTVWVGKGHPVTNTFLKPLVDQLNYLYETGIPWKYNNNTITSRFMVLLCSVDSVARSMILRMTQFNGAFGCTFCYQNGSTHGDSMKYPFQTKLVERTHEEIEELGEEALSLRDRILGVIGPSILCAIFGFDCVRGMVVEPLHNLFLGVSKQYTKLLLASETHIDEKNRKRYVSKNMAEKIIDQRLFKIRPPSRLTRRPRSIKDLNLWKGQEWRNWIQYYSLICFEGILKPKYLNHLSLLTEAINILNSDSITSIQIIRARKLLQNFVKEYERLFGKEAMTYNIHTSPIPCKTQVHYSHTMLLFLNLGIERFYNILQVPLAE